MCTVMDVGLVEKKLVLSIAIIASLLLIVSLLMVVIVTHIKSDCGTYAYDTKQRTGEETNNSADPDQNNFEGADDTKQRAGEETNNSADPDQNDFEEPKSKLNVENQTACPTQTPKLNLQNDFEGAFKPLDCYDILRNGNNISGVYEIYPLGVQKAVYCDQETDGGGWTVFQRRCDGSVNFFRGWNDYQRGFGHLSGEFWLGNQILSMLMKQRDYILRIDLEDFENETRYAQYNYFRIGNRSTNYRLTVKEYEGTAGDSLSYQNGRPFSTKDQDNDSWLIQNCALVFKGAWWYADCHHSCLNGLYYSGNHTSYADGVNWVDWKGHNYSLKITEMKCRPVHQ